VYKDRMDGRWKITAVLKKGINFDSLTETIGILRYLKFILEY
jgi:hypothetical protein